MNKYTVHVRTYNDRSKPDSLRGHSYGVTMFLPGVRANTASEAASKCSRTEGKCTSILGVSAVVLEPPDEVREATERSYQAYLVGLEGRFR